MTPITAAKELTVEESMIMIVISCSKVDIINYYKIYL